VLGAEIVTAREQGRAIVALETTILAHGMPYPQNLETARNLERIVREAGAVPATIGVLDGSIHIGLDEGQLERLASARGVRKLSRADLPYAIATGSDGSTTVAATMICAHLAGIEVFVTGGIGGVHRGAEKTFDVSPDLEELARTPVFVVCAGAKAILDLPKTLEVLETRGVPVICYGTDEFPAFWSRSSGLPAPMRLDSPDEIVRFVSVKRELGLLSGTVVANPIPASKEFPAADLRPFIEAVVEEARAANVAGKDVTPFLLDRLATLTGGRSLAANISLIENNARLGAQLAIALAMSR
jgi:pseudouridine-5'-phosphate glycosidase